MKIFVPAWGWVGSQWVHGARTTKKFSSPLGDGLVLSANRIKTSRCCVFVPAWGWVGSLPSHFIGWNNWVFVPEWGWVGSTLIGVYQTKTIFSSPSGDGLVHLSS